MAQEVRLRGGTTAQHTTFTGAAKEVTVDTTKNILVVHDGATLGGHPVAKQSEVDTSISTINDNLALKANADDVNDALALKANADDVAYAIALKANADDVNDALALKADANDVAGFLSFKVGQTLTQSERGQAVANLGAGILSGFRNKLINGDFDFWQRSTVQTSNGYGSDDRWSNEQAGSTKTHSRQSFSLGQTSVPGNPTFFSRTVVVSAAGSSSFVFKRQKIEGVRTLAGRKATVTFYAKADSPKSMAVEVLQRFGTGGSPSADVRADTRKVTLSSNWQKFSYAVDIPNIVGKTIGSNNDDFLHVAFWFDAGSNFNDATDTLGQQSGTFDIAHVSLVEGDAMEEEDPFSSRHRQQELSLCQRYFEKSYNIEVPPGTTSAPAGAVTRNMDAANNYGMLSFVFKVTKRAAPTCIPFSPNTGVGNLMAADGANYSVSVSRQSQSGFSCGVSNVSIPGGTFISAHFTADAEL